ncbi:MAG TPA: GNAT family N-acetyltransferase [Solirubrobacteraceae bacterium]|nr:GNAT family N-acetyltransferase [Solirubrobacteraceae bacterium]
MSEAHEQLLRRAYEAFNARDIDGVLAMMHADVDWPNEMEGGHLHGHQEVREYWRRQFDLIDSNVEPQRIEQRPDGQVVVTVRQVLRDRTGSVISEDVVEHRYVISKGLIERMEVGDRWTIRSASVQDIEPVLSLWNAAGSSPSVTDTREGLMRLVATDREALLIAQVGGSVVGSLIAAWDGWRGSFYRLVVHPDRRRQGIATALLREGERRLWARGAVRLTAIVIDEEAGAMGFWRAAGYEHQRHRARFVRPSGT